MRMIFALFVLACCTACGSATLKLFKPKLKPKPLIYPAVANYKPISYLSAPFVVSDPLPSSYARLSSTYGSRVSSYRVSLPTVETYAPAFAVPQSYETTFTAPVLTLAAPLVHYHEPETVYVEPFSSYVTHLIEEHFAKH